MKDPTENEPTIAASKREFLLIWTSVFKCDCNQATALKKKKSGGEKREETDEKINV